VSPLSRDLQYAFDRVAHTIDASKTFSVIFYDSNGFERCRGELSDITRRVDQGGQVVPLEGTGSMLGCSVDENVGAKNWNLSYQFPDLKQKKDEQRNDRLTPPRQERVRLKGPEGKFYTLPQNQVDAFLCVHPDYETAAHSATAKQAEDSEGEDELTGASYDGTLETESGHTLHVTRQAEIETIWSWLASDRIRYDCKLVAVW
jgi:hypothetical protein